jgi:hypothetical protein
MRQNPATPPRLPRQALIGLLDPNPTLIVCMALALALVVLAARIVNSL